MLSWMMRIIRQQGQATRYESYQLTFFPLADFLGEFDAFVKYRKIPGDRDTFTRTEFVQTSSCLLASLCRSR